MPKLYIGETPVNKLHLGDNMVVPAFAEGATIDLPKTSATTDAKSETK